MRKNAIILAAGKSNRFAPFTYEKPKGLFVVKGEVLIERQINQLIEAGIDEIIIVIGYMKEKFFYLEKKFPQVKLLINNTFGKYGNIYSIFTAKDYLKDSFICCADHYFVKNPFLNENSSNISYRATSYLSGSFREFSIKITDANVISSCAVGGSNSYAMIGHAYFNKNFSNKFKEYLVNEIDDFGISNMFWEEFYARHINELTLFSKNYDNNDVLEFDTIDELRKFDSDFLLNVDSEIVANICKILKCKPNDISDISIIQAGLTNVSFKFTANKKTFVYRHPGGNSGNLVDRKTEMSVQEEAKNIGLDKSFIYMDDSGWKMSNYIDNIIECNLLKNNHQLSKAMEYLHAVHNIKPTDDMKVFDNYTEGIKLIDLACSTKGNLYKEFGELISKVKKINSALKKERKKNNIELTVCHNDVYDPNFIATKEGELYLIDWEYAGLNDPLNDLCGIITRYEYSESEKNVFINEYFKGRPNSDELKHLLGQSIISSFYWFCWGLYKGSVGDDDGFFFLTSYNYLVNNIDDAIKAYTEK